MTMGVSIVYTELAIKSDYTDEHKLIYESMQYTTPPLLEEESPMINE